eukprot:CAMPEP_0119514268 /NCGR_PEP_ID=MMETSP1344-20130328/32134_1 /TAXON_ID=236787 /ORGANISM="Florenciella parvula, Strain CCMP2471" /LENGTH=88 /DNA_ID=CAMNT_0007551579 /DNA_START=382 /DNA_END=649 /DNA_ORIENTATION=-
MTPPRPARHHQRVGGAARPVEDEMARRRATSLEEEGPVQRLSYASYRPSLGKHATGDGRSGHDHLEDQPPASTKLRASVGTYPPCIDP